MNDSKKETGVPPAGESGAGGTGGNKKNFSLLFLAFEVGYTIALPLIFFALLGRFADKFFGTAPWLLLLGILLALLSSGTLIYKKVQGVIK